MNRPILIAALAAASAVIAFAASARTPVFARYEGVDGSSASSPVATASGDVNGRGTAGAMPKAVLTPRKAGDAPRAGQRTVPRRDTGAPTQPRQRVRAPSAQPQPDIVTAAGSGAGPGRDVTPPKPKPKGLLLPAIQKRR